MEYQLERTLEARSGSRGIVLSIHSLSLKGWIFAKKKDG
jgi:hypothetical protein